MNPDVKNKISTLSIFIIYLLFSQLHPFVHVHEHLVEENIELGLCIHYSGISDFHKHCDDYHHEHHEHQNLTENNIPVINILKKKKNISDVAFVNCIFSENIKTPDNYEEIPVKIYLFSPPNLKINLNKAPPLLS